MEPIVIESDDDFETNNWTGNGTISNPYVLANKTIEGYTCIAIERTSSYFRIENCTMTAEWYGILLHNSSNAVITNNTIKSGLSSIIIGGVTNCTIVNNSISRFSNSVPTGDGGIELHEVDNSTINDNVIKGGAYGILARFSSNCTMLRNTITCHGPTVYLHSSAHNNSIIGNRFASVTEEIAKDDGLNNSWDDGVSLGNAWIDHEGIGDYLIPGSANSVDHFPTVFNPSFPMDFSGPTITIYLASSHYNFYEHPSSWTFKAPVTDASGVDTVLVIVNGEPHEMSRDEDVDMYIYYHPNPSNMTFSFWANDTVGLESETEQGFISIGVYPGPGPITPFLFVIGGISVFAVAMLVILIKSKKSTM